MSRFAGVIVAAIIGLLSAGSAASAAPYRVTFLGTITEGSDSGVFGAAGSLAGERFAAIYNYDTEVGYHDTEPGVFDLITPIAASLKIKGVTYVFPLYDILTADAYMTPGTLGFAFLHVTDADPVDIQAITNQAHDPLLGSSLDFGSSFQLAVSEGGSFGIDICCCPHCSPGYETHAHGSFATDTVQVLAVPEPGVWTILIVGFGVAGGALRRRRAAA